MTTPLQPIDYEQARHEAHRLRNEAMAAAGAALLSLLRRGLARLGPGAPRRSANGLPRLG